MFCTPFEGLEQSSDKNSEKKIKFTWFPRNVLASEKNNSGTITGIKKIVPVSISKDLAIKSIALLQSIIRSIFTDRDIPPS